MPKVLIKEIDNSTSGLLESNNFTVVVPGFAGHSAPGYNLADILDENGCAEFTSQADFINYVGLRGACDRIEPTSASLDSFVKQEIDDKVKQYIYTYETDLIVNNFLIYDKVPVTENVEETVTLQDGSTVTKTRSNVKTGETEDKTKGKVNLTKDKLSGVYYYMDNKEKRFVYVATKSETEISGHNVIQISTGTKASKDGTAAVNECYRVTPVTDLNQILTIVSDEGSKGIYYTIRKDVNFAIAKGNDGDSYKGKVLKFGDDGVAFRHKGNQIAYEVLGMGFPVLFKQLHGTWVKPEGLDIKNELEDINFWECLKDKSMYNFRFITTGGEFSAAANNCIVAIADYKNDTTIEDHEIFWNVKGRGDCTALCDFNEEKIDTTSMKALLTSVGNAVAEIKDSKFGAIFGPRVVFQMSDSEANLFEGGDSARTFPASIYYLSCLANSLTKYSEWYAAAGYTRGISKRRVDHTTIKFGEIANNTLAPRVINEYTDKAVNLVICEHNSYYLGGNRTACKLNRSGLTFSHYLNIRQLCTTIKKRLYSVCKQFTFDPNSELLWINFVNAIKPTLEAMRADQGINGYKISQVKTAKKGVLKANIRIVPIEAVEDFDISLSLEDSLSGIVLGADETEAE